MEPSDYEKVELYAKFFFIIIIINVVDRATGSVRLSVCLSVCRQVLRRVQSSSGDA